MKNKTKRVLTSLVSAVMAVSAVTSGALFSAVAEEEEKEKPVYELDEDTIYVIPTNPNAPEKEYALPEKGSTGGKNPKDPEIQYSDYVLHKDGTVDFIGGGLLQNYKPEYCSYVEDIRTRAVVYAYDTILDRCAFGATPYTYFDLSATGMESLSYAAFNNCKIEEIKLPYTLKKIDEAAFQGAELDTIDLPSSLEVIDEDAFYVSKIKSIALPKQVKTIGHEAFYGCRNLSEVTLNEGLEYIGGNAFNESGVENIDLPSSVNYVGSYAFYDCRNLKTAKINSEFVYNEDEKDEDKFIFKDCINLEKVELSDDVETVWGYQFYNCEKLKDVKVSKNLKTIKQFGFARTAIESIDLPEGLETIEDGGLYSTKLKEVVIPKSVSYIGSSALGIPTIEKITILNPDCEFHVSAISGSTDTVIYGYKGSTAEKYAAENSKKFVALDAETATTSSTKPAVTTTAKTTATTKASTTTTAKTTATTKAATTTTAKTSATTKAATTTTAKTSATTKAATTTTAKTSATTKAATTTTAASDYVAGDANCDGKVDISDAVIIMQSISNPSKYSVIGTDPSHMTKAGQLNADVNNHGDGMTNKDALTIQKYALQLIDTLPES